jgi:two-component system, OmpR family, KDP operon response regulator KdpE
MKILVADDDPQLVRALRITLAAHGYDVVAAADGAAAVTLAAQSHPDLVLLDLGMPHLDGVQVIQALRGWTSAPIIVVSGRTGSADKVDALDAGADDYVTKPFQVDELLARLRALSRRSSAASTEPVVSFGDVTVDLAAKVVTRDGAAVHLTPTEWRMLEFLARHPGALVTRQTLLKEIWATDNVSDSGYLRLYMSQLRKKLEADPAHPAHLLTEQGMGYRLVVAP